MKDVSTYSQPDKVSTVLKDQQNVFLHCKVGPYSCNINCNRTTSLAQKHTFVETQYFLSKHGNVTCI